MVPVTKPFLPPKKEYFEMIDELWKTRRVTNNGKLVQKLERSLENYLGVNKLFFVTNGTMALQIAIKSLDLEGGIITTPFSFVATTSSIIWESCTPIFVDIDPKTLCIDPDKIEKAITNNTVAILATHVYGIPCDVHKIEKIARKYNLKIIYDAAHAFGVRLHDKSVLEYGDISILSFHATKVFHTVEGGALICNKNETLANKIELLRNFGKVNDNYYFPGINGKNSEFHAAMGLTNLKYIDAIINKRKELSNLYDQLLNDVNVTIVSIPDNVTYNYAYYPIILNNVEELDKTRKELKNNGIEARRYFYPSLNKLSYIKNKVDCPISEAIAKRVLCLPLYSDLKTETVAKITSIIKRALK